MPPPTRQREPWDPLNPQPLVPCPPPLLTQHPKAVHVPCRLHVALQDELGAGVRHRSRTAHRQVGAACEGGRVQGEGGGGQVMATTCGPARRRQSEVCYGACCLECATVLRVVGGCSLRYVTVHATWGVLRLEVCCRWMQPEVCTRWMIRA